MVVGAGGVVGIGATGCGGDPARPAAVDAGAAHSVRCVPHDDGGIAVDLDCVSADGVSLDRSAYYVGCVRDGVTLGAPWQAACGPYGDGGAQVPVCRSSESSSVLFVAKCCGRDDPIPCMPL